MPIIISILASIAAFAGGAIALRFKDKLHLILGLSAGAVIGAALFDLIPEAIELGESAFHAEEITALAALGFLAYLVLDRLFSFHGNHDENPAAVDGARRGSLGAASFCLHSLIDGIAIGLAFQASAAVGIVVGAAVLAHRFSDGINTVGIILKHSGTGGGESRRAKLWLAAVALAPIVGTLSTLFFSVTEKTLAVILSVFAGFFLYIGASDLIPEGHHSHSKLLTTTMTVMGAAAMYAIVVLAHGA
jgi:ZIP family zinc transporter